MTSSSTSVRRESGRSRSHMALSRSSSELSPARTACPKNDDAFSYDPNHLRYWSFADPLWPRFSLELRSSLEDLQRAGAAALTGCERLENHAKGLNADRTDRKISMDELLVGFDDLPPPVWRTNSNTSSVSMSEGSQPPSVATSAPHSGNISPVAPVVALSEPKSPSSPFLLGPPELESKLRLPRERSFSTPLEPADAYYDVELSHLRTEALPRLRHKCHKIDTIWYEAKRSGAFDQLDITTFETWWAEKKCKIFELQECITRLANERGLARTGLGWCAP